MRRASKMRAGVMASKARTLLARDGATCWLCGEALGADITLDHVVPRSQGGKNKNTNLRLAHRRCNSDRGDSAAEG